MQRNINTNTLNANQVIDNGDNSIDENNNNNGCSCSCGNCYRGNCSYNLNRNYNGIIIDVEDRLYKIWMKFFVWHIIKKVLL